MKNAIKNFVNRKPNFSSSALPSFVPLHKKLKGTNRAFFKEILKILLTSIAFLLVDRLRGGYNSVELDTILIACHFLDMA